MVGLGNPGKKYARTRHNAGFMFVDYFWKNFREDFGFSDWKLDKKLKSEISVGKIRGEKNKSWKLLAYAKSFQLGEENFRGAKLILLKPQTFVNLSGEAVLAVKKYYKVKLEDIIIAHDDIDLALGKYKISVSSSSAGHNGVQNVIDMLGTKDFARIRIGVENRSNKKIPTEKYVLGNFTAAEMKMTSRIFQEISEDKIKHF